MVVVWFGGFVTMCFSYYVLCCVAVLQLVWVLSVVLWLCYFALVWCLDSFVGCFMVGNLVLL